MNTWSAPSAMLAAAAGNHLWQSTVCLAVAAALALALRPNRACVRYAIWIAASAKFLVPIAPLMALGSRLAPRAAAPLAPPAMATLVGTVSQPFTWTSAAAASAGLPRTTSFDAATVLFMVMVAIWLAGCAVTLATWLRQWRRLASIVRRAVPVQSGPEVSMLRRLEARAGVRVPTPLVSSSLPLEPGVFGVLTSTLLWPRDIAAQLSPGQLEALLAHEVCHIRRRDNLIAAMHMAVEALFWFHPLVWWLETRLVEERERACDEAVMCWGHEPVAYAQGILKTCELCTETPLACVAGVTGAGLKQRIEAIALRQTGYFDAEFDFMAELPPPPPPPGMPNPFGNELLSVFTLLPEQLGLRLDARRGPVDVLVIDNVQQPTPD